MTTCLAVQMNVRIVEAGNHQPAAQIDDARRTIGFRQFVGAHRNDLAVLHDDRLVDRERLVDGRDGAVVEDEIGWLLCLGPRGSGDDGNNDKEARSSHHGHLLPVGRVSRRNLILDTIRAEAT